MTLPEYDAVWVNGGSYLKMKIEIIPKCLNISKRSRYPVRHLSNRPDENLRDPSSLWI